MKTARTSEQDRIISIYEAAEALAHLHYKVKFDFVTIDPPYGIGDYIEGMVFADEPDFLGQKWADEYYYDSRLLFDDELENLKWDEFNEYADEARTHAKIALAGQVACEIAGVKPPDSLRYRDNSKALKFLTKAGDNNGDGGTLLVIYEDRAREELFKSSNWKAVEVIAASLIEHRTVHYDFVRKLVSMLSYL